MPWATISDTTALTGTTVDESTLGQAQGVVELFAGITEDNTATMSNGNARMLKAATAYQAAWMKSQVDVTGRMDVAEVQQDGATVKPAGPDDLVLAPLAKRCLDRLTWRGRRSITLTVGAPQYVGDPLAAFLTDSGPGCWTPVGAA